MGYKVMLGNELRLRMVARSVARFVGCCAVLNVCELGTQCRLPARSGSNVDLSEQRASRVSVGQTSMYIRDGGEVRSIQV